MNRPKLQYEQNKLDMLVDEALSNGTPLCDTYKIMRQCRKIDALMLEMEAQDIKQEKP